MKRRGICASSKTSYWGMLHMLGQCMPGQMGSYCCDIIALDVYLIHVLLRRCLTREVFGTQVSRGLRSAGCGPGYCMVGLDLWRLASWSEIGRSLVARWVVSWPCGFLAVFSSTRLSLGRRAKFYNKYEFWNGKDWCMATRVGVLWFTLVRQMVGTLDCMA